ncbi:MAG: hypothetical protein ACLU0O_02060 [Collinsella sp.]
MIYIAALGDVEGKIALREVADREHISAKVFGAVGPSAHEGGPA